MTSLFQILNFPRLLVAPNPRFVWPCEWHDKKIGPTCDFDFSLLLSLKDIAVELGEGSFPMRCVCSSLCGFTFVIKRMFLGSVCFLADTSTLKKKTKAKIYSIDNR